MATILAVDDHAGMRRIVLMTRQEAGYDLVEVAGGAAALQGAEG